MIAALAVFSATYLLIVGRRLSLLHLGRPAGALVGAVGMVLFKVLTPGEAYGLIDLNTLVLLFGMMVISGYLDESGFFSALAQATLRRASEPRVLLGAVVWVSGIASAFLMNDTVCLMMTPVVAAMTLALRVDPLPYLLALATSSNIGSVATLAGNPQNMLIGTASHIPYRDYILVMGPIAVLCLAVNHALLLRVYGPRLERAAGEGEEEPSPRVRKALMVKALVALGAVVLAWFLGADLSFAAGAGAALVILLARFSPHRILARLDWSLLLFFAALFVVVGGVESTGVLDYLGRFVPRGTGAAGIAGFSVISVFGSNLFSNVPFVLVAGKWVASLPEPRLHWYLLALTSTFAGNLTLVGSMANLIVAELARGVRPIGFREYFRYGAVLTAITTLLGVLYLAVVAG